MILQGDAAIKLRTLPSESAHMAITSPPYWNLRDYHVNGQLGLEQRYDEYITKLCDVFDEVRRVLRPDGTLWVNLADNYSGRTVTHDHKVSPFQSQDSSPAEERCPAQVSLPYSHPFCR